MSRIEKGELSCEATLRLERQRRTGARFQQYCVNRNT